MIGDLVGFRFVVLVYCDCALLTVFVLVIYVALVLGLDLYLFVVGVVTIVGG